MLTFVTISINYKHLNIIYIYQISTLEILAWGGTTHMETEKEYIEITIEKDCFKEECIDYNEKLLKILDDHYSLSK